MILGTAGHIDHGKTTLVRALTGVDTDRLKEEKARGISIELGYAYTPVPAAPGDASAAAPGDDPAQVLGIIDVPGHERFVHTMAAGASGIDHALLVVAADDGVMPQTREHLAIVELFGIGEGTVALTKCDRVDAARIAAVKADIAALLAGTPLAGAPIFETGVPPGVTPSPLRGEGGGEGQPATADPTGITALRTHLFTIARRQHARRQDGLFRLAIDRVFTLAGHGTVVTGTVFGGRIAAGDTVAHFGSGSGDGRAPPRAVRVRSLHAQNRAATNGVAGQRVALNLAGVDKSDIARGDWIADPRLLQATQRIDVRVRLLDGAPPIAAWTPLHVHIGAAHRLAHAVPLQGDTVTAASTTASHTTAPGARVQLVFDQPVFVVLGDRLILRNAQGTRTVGGGVVLDPQAPERRRRSAERMQWLDALERLVADGDARPLLAVAPAGLTRSGLARLLGRLPADDWAGPDAPAFALGQPAARHRDAAAAASQAKSASSARPAGASSYEIDSNSAADGTTPPAADAPARAAASAHGGDVLWLSPAVWAQVRARILDALERHHARAPDEPGLNSARLQRMAFPAQAAASGAAPGWPAWIEWLIAEGSVVRSGQWLHLPGHSVSLSDDESEMAAQLMPLLLAGGNDPPWVRDLAKAIGAREDTVRELLRKQARLGALYQVVKDLFYPAERIAELATTFAGLSAASPADPARATARFPAGAVEARDFRDAVQLGRKRTIQILEFFDRVGYTRRVGDAHLPRPNTRWGAEGPESEGISPAP